MKNNNEIWKPVPDFPGYEVSSKGRVKSTARLVHASNKYGSYSYSIPEKIMRQSTRTNYLCVTLCLEGKHINVLVHRLVAKAFIPNPYDFAEVNHKDENKLNNCVENLEWCNRKYNKNYGTGAKRSGQNRSKKILQFTKDLKFIKEWPSMMDAAKYYNNDRKGIWSVCNGINRTAQGFVWRYKQ